MRVDRLLQVMLVTIFVVIGLMLLGGLVYGIYCVATGEPVGWAGILGFAFITTFVAFIARLDYLDKRDQARKVELEDVTGNAVIHSSEPLSEEEADSLLDAWRRYRTPNDPGSVSPQ